MQQCLIFDDLEEIPAVKVIKKTKVNKGTGKKRGHYKPRKKKIKVLSFYEELAKLQRELAIILKPYLLLKQNIDLKEGNFFSQHTEIVEEYKYFRFWFKKYRYAINSTLYKQNDVFICKYNFDEFENISLELKGCEKLGIRESLYIHKQFKKKFLTLPTNLVSAAAYLQPLILKFQKGEIILNDNIDTTIQEIILNDEKKYTVD